MKGLRLITTNLTKVVILEAGTRSISLGEVRHAAPSCRCWLTQVIIDSLPIDHSYGFLQAAAGPWISIRATNMRLHQFAFHYGDVECIWTRVMHRLECADPAGPSPSRQRSIPKVKLGHC